MKNPILILLLTFLFFSVNSQNVISINIKANKLQFDSKRNKIYASINGLDVTHGNSLVKLNPLTGAIEKSIYVGSEPAELALTKDTNYLYIAFDGASFVKRVSLDSFVVDRTVSIGTNSLGALFAQDIATVKQSADLIVVARKNTASSPIHAGVAAYYKGIKLPGETPGHTGSNAIESANDSNFVVGFNTESTESGVRKMTIDSISGVTLISTTPNLPMGRNIEYHDRLIYASSGKVLDPFTSPPTIVGTCQLGIGGSFNYNAVEADIKTNMIYFCSAQNSLSIKYYKLQTYSFVNDTILPNAFPVNFQLPESVDLIRYGSNGIGVIVRENYFTNQERRVVLSSLETAVGFSEYTMASEPLQMKPNPTNSSFQIDNKKIRYVEITDMTGSSIYSQNVSPEQEIWIDLKLLGACEGLYIIRALNQQGVVSYGKIIYSMQFH